MYSPANKLTKEICTFVADIFVVGLSIIDNLSNELPAHQDVDRLQVKVYYLVVSQISETMKHVE